VATVATVAAVTRLLKQSLLPRRPER
jgi:hypothetical protein